MVLFKAFWSIVHNTSSILARVCNAKYVKEGILWTAGCSPVNNTFWAQIIHTRDKLLQNFTYQMGSGEQIQAVGAPWFLSWQTNCRSDVPPHLCVDDLFNSLTAE
jgi:hypothetical protein